MFQLPVNNLARLRKARKRVKRLLSDIGLDYCKEHVEDYKEFGPDDFYMKHFSFDVCVWDPSWTKSQEYRTKQFCCSDCSFASKYFSAYKNHFRNVHRNDFENRILLNCSYCMYSGNKPTLETHVRLFHMPYHIVRQGISNPLGDIMGGKDSMRMDKPILTDRKELAMYYCKKCSYQDRLYNVLRRHIYREHLQHVITPYVVKNQRKQENCEEAGSPGIHCKSCLFVPHSYEALVQHVIEFHENIAYQVTAMIGHTNVLVTHKEASAIPRGAPVTPGIPPHMVHPVNCFNVPKVIRGLPVGNHFKQVVTGSSGQQLYVTLPEKALSSIASQSCTGKYQSSFVVTSSHCNVSTSPSRKALPLSSVYAKTATMASLQVKKGSVNPLNTSQTHNSTVCNELFSENVYPIHIEKEHQLERVQAVAKYIMKIHNFTSKCLYCNRYLPNDTLLNHMLSHGLTCPQCHTTFYDVEKMVVHKRQMHPNVTGALTMDCSLTFDLMLQQGSPKNLQLIVTTHNVKEIPKSQRSSKLVLENASKNIVPQEREKGKTICTLCFSILKGPITDILDQHLQDQHQVLQTLHPVHKKLIYKCIHCLGMYASNITASTITLHLAHCQGVRHDTKVQKNSISALKRELPTSDTSNPKKKKMVTQSGFYPLVVMEKPSEPVLVLDPRGHANKSYDARKAFLNAYFNQQPYPSQQEVEKLAASLWLWKSDVLNHFANQRQSCERDFLNRNALVLLGFSMQSVIKLKHEMSFGHKWLFTVNDEKRSEVSRTVKKRQKASNFSTGRLNSTYVKEALNHEQCHQNNKAIKPSDGTLESFATDLWRGSEKDPMPVNNVTLKNAPTFTSVIQTWTTENLQQERFLCKSDGRVVGSDIAKRGSKFVDGCTSRSRTEEAAWSGSMSPDESLYRPAERFEEKGKEMGLLGR